MAAFRQLLGVTSRYVSLFVNRDGSYNVIVERSSDDAWAIYEGVEKLDTALAAKLIMVQLT